MIRLLGILFLSASIISCTTTPPSAPGRPIPWKQRELALNQLQSWTLHGKIAAQTTQDSGSASVDWTQRHDQYVISLLGPFGSNGLRLTGHPGSVLLETADGKRYRASNAEQLLANNWGFHVPVSYLHYWIRGLPVPTIPAKTMLDSSGRLSELAQQQWLVQFLGYENVGAMDLPNRIVITSPTLNVKIVVHEWRV